MHIQAKLPNFEQPLWFSFVLGPYVKDRPSISSSSSILTTPNVFSIVSRKRYRLSTVQIKHSMGFVLSLFLSVKFRHFLRRGMGDRCIPMQLNASSAWHKLGLNAALVEAMPVEVLESGDENLQCAVSPWGEYGVYTTNQTTNLRNRNFTVGYLDTLASTRLLFYATQPSQGCSLVSSCKLSMFGPEWITSREKPVLEEAGLVTQWVAFLPLSQCCTNCGAKGGCSTNVAEFWTRLRN